MAFIFIPCFFLNTSSLFLNLLPCRICFLFKTKRNCVEQVLLDGILTLLLSAFKLIFCRRVFAVNNALVFVYYVAANLLMTGLMGALMRNGIIYIIL